ncbi:hypothetical protein V1512DRAFT_115244 [Lipomyces arxii]|uniref:uncharacterized protein n=1 Tax=Lipomyces arxii TaxID=56418 RepID=UPI0034CE9806
MAAVNTEQVESVLLEVLRSSNLDVATLKSIRTEVVNKIGLPADFFKDSYWRTRSSELADLVISESEKLRKKLTSPAKKGTRRKLEHNASPPKKGIISVEPIENIDQSNYSDVSDETPKTQKTKVKQELPKEKKLRSKERRKRSSKSKTPEDSVEAKIASLKSWVVKCGVRKQWTRELAPFESGKEKIQYLQNLLAELGMVPRYSLEKAKKIKAEREFAAEVAQLQADSRGLSSGAQSHSETQANSRNNDKPKRVVAGNFSIDFLGDQSDSD